MDTLLDTKIIVALIAVIVSFISLIISKETKISDFRQKWIDNIRDDISELMGTLTQYTIVYIVSNPQDRESKEKFFNENHELVSKIGTLLNKIELRLNPEKDKELIKHLNAIEDFTTIPKEDKLEKLTATMNTLKEQSHILLKKEWERVKKGELVYRVIKYSFATIVFVFMLYFSYTVYKTTDATEKAHNKYEETNNLP